MRLNKTKIAHTSTKEPININNSAHDMVIAFDTTGSMARYIDDVKKHVKTLIPELLTANPGIQISVVAFGDYCDMESVVNFGKAYQVINLTRNENALIEFVSKAKNTSGGDGDEFYELVLKKILDETSWRENSKKSILLIADASPHKIGYSFRPSFCSTPVWYVQNNQIDWRKEAERAASMGVQIDTLDIEGNSWYKELSKITNGVHALFKSDNKTVEAVKMSAYSRGGTATKDLYIKNVVAYANSKDEELKSMSTAFFKNMAEDTSLSSAEISEIVSAFEVTPEIPDVVIPRTSVIDTTRTTSSTETAIPLNKENLMKINLNEIQIGDVFSEESHYIVKSKDASSITFQHLESGQTVSLSNSYVTKMLNTSDQYQSEVKVTKEDKKDGTPGIRTIFEHIRSSEVFTVVFQKQDKTKTKKAIAEEKAAQRAEAVALIEKAKKAKKSMAIAYAEALEFIQNNPISDVIPGEMRVLRGYKKQFVSRDGKYMCQDMDIALTEKETGERLVNINTISALIYNGIKYIVED